MFRFHEFDTSQIPDFWLKKFQNPELIRLMAYINSVLGAKTGGYKLLQGYDIMNVGEHMPGAVFAWEPLTLMSYRHTEGVAYPHSYAIPSNILYIQNIYDKRSDPNITMQVGIDYSLDEDSLGILRFVKDPPTKPVTVTRGNVQGFELDDDNVATLKVTFKDFVPRSDFGFIYSIDQDVDSWGAIKALEIMNRSGEVGQWWENIDFVFDAPNGLIKTHTKLPLIPLVMSKGTLVSTRLSDDFGKLFGFSRYDSTMYRDVTAQLMPLFFVAPTIENVVSAANAAFKLPVSKYGDETLKGIRRTAADTMLLTDKYQYKMYGANSPLVLGDTIDHNQQLSDALTFYTQRTNPEWYLDRAPGLFQKYAEDPLTMSRKNRMMDTFLKRYLAHVRVDLDKVNTTTFKFIDDIWSTLFDGLPVRSDIIVSTYKHIYDLDMKMPDFEKMKLRARYFTLWTDNTESINEDLRIPTRKIIDHHILTAHEPVHDWTVGGNRYKIVGANEQFKQFWSRDKMQTPYVEPNWDRCWWRTVAAPTLPVIQVFRKDLFTVFPAEVRLTPGARAGSNVMHKLSAERDIAAGAGPMNDTAISSEYIAGDTVYDFSDFQSWELHSLWLGIDGIICPISGTGYVISEVFSIGMVPKDITVDYRADIPYGCGISIEFALGAGENRDMVFTPLPKDGTLYGIRGKFRLKISLTANSYNFPNLTEVIYTTRVIRNNEFQQQWATANI